MDIQIPFNNNTVIHSSTDLFILCRRNENDFTLKRADNKFYRSTALYRNTMVLDSSVVQSYWFDPETLPEQITVLILKHDSDDTLVFRSIESFQHMVRYLRFAECNACNLTSLEGNIVFDGPFVELERRSMIQWQKHKILLNSIFHRAFKMMHFENPNANAPNGYDALDPTTADKTKKYFPRVKFQPIAKDKAESLISQEDYDWMIKHLVDLSLNNTVVLIIKATLLSIDYCQLAMKNPFLKSIIHSFPEVATGIIYAMQILYLEEKAKYIATEWDERYLFNLEQVQGLPIFRKFNWDNPYLLTTGYQHRLGQQLIIPALWKGRRGVYNTEEARERLDAYTGGVFANLEWTHKATGVRTALCGSAIPAIFAKNPLEDGMGDMTSYFQEYYPAIQHGVAGLPEKENNISSSGAWEVELSDEEQEHFIIETTPDASGDEADNIVQAVQPVRRFRRSHRRGVLNVPDVVMLPQTANENVDDEEEGPSEATPLEKLYDRFTDIDLMIETDDLELFDKVCESHFEAIRSTLPETQRDKVYMKMFATENKYRYKIYGLPRSIELFCVNSIPGVIAKFHLACVRAWWDGEQLHMYPSFVTAAMTGVCHELRWTSCNKDLRDIVLKYYQRGFAIMLNRQEVNNLIQYTANNPKWPCFPPAPQNGRYWEQRLWRNKPFYYDVQADFWNPSISHFGVYFKLKGVQRKGLTRPEWTRNFNRYGGMSWQNPKSRGRSLYRILAPDKINWKVMKSIYSDN